MSNQITTSFITMVCSVATIQHTLSWCQPQQEHKTLVYFPSGIIEFCKNVNHTCMYILCAWQFCSIYHFLITIASVTVSLVSLAFNVDPSSSLQYSTKHSITCTVYTHYNYICDWICKAPYTHIMTKYSFHYQSIALLISEQANSVPLPNEAVY